MADRILSWFIPGTPTSNTARQGPTFYIESSYEPTAVRIYAEKAPTISDMEIDIFDDGVSLFNNRRDEPGVNVKSFPLAKTTVLLPAGEHEELDAEDFVGEDIEEGSWVYLIIPVSAGAQNITIQLELEDASEIEAIPE